MNFLLRIVNIVSMSAHVCILASYRIVIGDEKWILYNNFRRRHQWLGKSARPKPEPREEFHWKKILLCVGWDMRGIIHYELLQDNQTITAEYYCQQLKNLAQLLKEAFSFNQLLRDYPSTRQCTSTYRAYDSRIYSVFMLEKTSLPTWLSRYFSIWILWARHSKIDK